MQISSPLKCPQCQGVFLSSGTLPGSPEVCPHCAYSAARNQFPQCMDAAPRGAPLKIQRRVLGGKIPGPRDSIPPPRVPDDRLPPVVSGKGFRFDVGAAGKTANTPPSPPHPMAGDIAHFLEEIGGKDDAALDGIEEMDLALPVAGQYPTAGVVPSPFMREDAPGAIAPLPPLQNAPVSGIAETPPVRAGQGMDVGMRPATSRLPQASSPFTLPVGAAKKEEADPFHWQKDQSMVMDSPIDPSDERAFSPPLPEIPTATDAAAPDIDWDGDAVTARNSHLRLVIHVLWAATALTTLTLGLMKHGGGGSSPAAVAGSGAPDKTSLFGELGSKTKVSRENEVPTPETEDKILEDKLAKELAAVNQTAYLAESESKILAAFGTFVSASKASDRIPFVFDGDRHALAMEEWTRNHPEPLVLNRSRVVKSIKGPNGESMFWVAFSTPQLPEEMVIRIWLTVEGETKIEWDLFASVVEKRLQKFAQNVPNENETVTVSCFALRRTAITSAGGPFGANTIEFVLRDHMGQGSWSTSVFLDKTSNLGLILDSEVDFTVMYPVRCKLVWRKDRAGPPFIELQAWELLRAFIEKADRAPPPQEIKRAEIVEDPADTIPIPDTPVPENGTE